MSEDTARSAEQPAVTLSAVTCKNCGALVSARYCGECSQARDVHMPSTHELLHDALEGITHSDSRLWRTLRTLWFKPGALSEEYIAGKRMSYLPPFRLYLIVSVAYFFLASFVHQDMVILSFQDDNPKVNVDPKEFSCDQVNMGTVIGIPKLDPRFRRVCQDGIANHGAELKHLMAGAVPKAMFVFLPLIAWLSMLFYWRPRYPFAVHWLFFLHLHAFFFSAAILTQLIELLENAWPPFKYPGSLIKFAIFWLLIVYALKALRRIFKDGWPLTLAKGAGLTLVYFATFLLMFMVVLIYAAFQM